MPTIAPKKTAPKAILANNLKRVAGAMLLLAGLTLLVGCQGVSAGASNQQQTSTLSLASTSLDFGSVPAGSSKTMSVNATNSGNTSITINSAAISTKYFTLTSPSLPVTIAAGKSTAVSVKFTPNEAGSFGATASVSSDASNGPTTSLSLSGTGVADGQLAINPVSESFSSVTVGNAQSVTVKVTNNGGSSVNITQVSVSGAGFQLSGITAPLTLNASQNTSFTVTFAPQVAGTTNGSVTITSDGSNPTLTMPLAGTGVATTASLSANPPSLNFGSVTVGQTSPVLTTTLTNTGNTTVTFSSDSITGDFSWGGAGTCANPGGTLAPGATCIYSAKFTPTASGTRSGNITVNSNAPTLNISLSGTGVAQTGTLTVSPATLNLGTVVVGNSGTASGSLTASGPNVTITAASTNNSVFTLSGLSLPLTIPAGQSAPFTVTFSPQVSGTVTAALTFTSNAQPATTSETLTGTGTPTPTHSVNLSWNASTSPNISGYNVYRAIYVSSCGSFSKINSVLETATLYTDSTVADSTNYCYATTAVNSSNEESSYSNIVSNVQIPAP